MTSVYTYDEKEGEEGEGGRRGDERYRDVSSDPRLLDLSPQRTLSPSSPSFTSSSQTGVLIMEFRGGSTCLAIDYKGEAGSTELCLSVSTECTCSNIMVNIPYDYSIVMHFSCFNVILFFYCTGGRVSDSTLS